MSTRSRAKGPHLTIVLNGQKTADVDDSKHLSGPFALQYGSGVVKFRKVQIKPLYSGVTAERHGDQLDERWTGLSRVLQRVGLSGARPMRCG